MMAILGFPLIIPQVLLLMRISNAAFGVVQTGLTEMILLLAGLDMLVIVLAVILFPFLWKD
jgi:heme exporter protein B